jgi:hypothetical protein
MSPDLLLVQQLPEQLHPASLRRSLCTSVPPSTSAPYDSRPRITKSFHIVSAAGRAENLEEVRLCKPTSIPRRHASTSRSSRTTMSGIPQTFWSAPIKYLRWAMHEKTAIFWSVVVGSSGPPLLYTLPSIRKRFGDEDPAPVPHTYPGKLRPHRKLRL